MKISKRYFVLYWALLIEIFLIYGPVASLMSLSIIFVVLCDLWQSRKKEV